MPRLAQNPHTPLERLRQSQRDKAERWRSLLAQPEIRPESAWPQYVTNVPLITTSWTTANANFYPTTITATTATNIWWPNVPVVPYQGQGQLDARWWYYGTGNPNPIAVAPPALAWTAVRGDDPDYEARRRRDAILREKARKRGRRLLMGILNDQQLIEYAKTRGFTVFGDKGGIFRIQKVGRVQELDLYCQIIALHCIHLSFAYIEEDNLVALKMLIETDEMEFRHIANTQHTHPLPLQEAA